MHKSCDFLGEKKKVTKRIYGSKQFKPMNNIAPMRPPPDGGGGSPLYK